DVVQVADAIVHTALVREVRQPALLGEDRVVQLDTDERPSPAGDVSERRLVRGHPDHGRGRVVRSDQGQNGRARGIGGRPDLVYQWTDHVAGGSDTPGESAAE